MSEYFAVNDPARRTQLDNLLRLDAQLEWCERVGNETEAARIKALIQLHMLNTGLTPLDLEQAKAKARHE